MTPTPLRPLSVSQQISKMMSLLQKLPAENATDDLFKEVCTWILDLPPSQRPEAITAAVSQAFRRPIGDIELLLHPQDKRVEFDPLVPTGGWIGDYIDWTRQTEPPTIFHFFVAAAVVGATLGRNVYFNKGAYKVYPNLCVVIVAPTGRCRKTSACNMGTSLYVRAGGTFIADKTTPEALVDALKTTQSATGLIYAPELAVFLGKQKYQEGMIPLLTSLFDCPDEWTSKTVGRGETTLTNVALSALLCSTIDWIQTAIPKDAFGGGFMSRFLFVVQETTSRSFPLPPARSEERKKELVARLLKLRNLKGEFRMTDAATLWYVRWYRSRPSSHADKQYAGYFERKPDHMLRIAMVLIAARSDTLIIDEPDLQQAERILHWMEAWLPATFDEMTSSGAGDDHARILRILKQSGGSMEHSKLLRRMSSRLTAEQFKRSVSTLREAKMIEWDAIGKTYYLTSIGWE